MNEHKHKKKNEKKKKLQQGQANAQGQCIVVRKLRKHQVHLSAQEGGLLPGYPNQ